MTHFLRCPKCKSEEPEFDNGETSGHYVVDRYECKDCGTKFSLVYEALLTEYSWSPDFIDKNGKRQTFRYERTSADDIIDRVNAMSIEEIDAALSDN